MKIDCSQCDDETMVCRFTSELAAETARAALAAEGIDAMVMTDDCGGLLPCLQELGGVVLRTSPELVEGARAILASAPIPDPEETDPRGDS